LALPITSASRGAAFATVFRDSPAANDGPTASKLSPATSSNFTKPIRIAAICHARRLSSTKACHQIDGQPAVCLDFRIVLRIIPKAALPRLRTFQLPAIQNLHGRLQPTATGVSDRHHARGVDMPCPAGLPRAY
jgi:hypothetical protein